MQVPVAAPMHPDPMPIRFSRHAPAHAQPARGGSDIWKRSEDIRIGCGSERTKILDTKKARACAPPGESLFSSLFNVAARGGKSPRLTSVVVVSLCLATRAVKPCASTLRARPANRAVTCSLWGRLLAPVTQARSGKVVNVCRASRFRSAESHLRRRVRASRLARVGRTFHVSSPQYSHLDDPFAPPNQMVT